MATKTKSFTANSTFQSIVSGPKVVTLNPAIGAVTIYIGSSAPAANTTDTFLVKPVAGENYLDIELGSGDTLYVKSVRESATLTWIERDPA